MAKRHLSKKIIRDVVTANQPCNFASIDDAIGAMEDVVSNSTLVKGFLEQMVEIGALTLEKGNYSVTAKRSGGSAPTRLYRVEKAKDGTLSISEREYDKDVEGTDGWKRTALAAIKAFKTAEYAKWLEVLEPIRALQQEHAPKRDEKEAA